MASDLTPDEWQRVKKILDEALDVPAPDRAAFLEARCAGDETLRREVESLAAVAEPAWSFVETPPGDREASFADRAPASRVGDRVGAYELLAELGRGGMGMVYLARRADEEFEKKVAIKLVRPGMATEFALQRFRSERQIAASLEHPHIARLLDGGTTAAGEPYFVMEYVEGEPLVEFCNRRRLPVRERLRLFDMVCAAVQYAHQNLVVHRDIKPGNILVTPEGVPKLMDFGIAKLLDPEGTLDSEAETRTLLRVMTPSYASPEQIRGQRITTASDVYALGVVLYELLAGRKPYDVAGADRAELERIVCESDPEKPSEASHARELRGDLDAIVLKAMRKEPESRYASVGELAEDLRRQEAGEPVRARRGTVSYLASKFARRHRVALMAAVAVAAALATGVVVALQEARRARAAEAHAQRRFEDVRQLANSFLFEIDDSIRDLPGSTPTRLLLVRRALAYLDDLSRESAGDRALRRELAEAYLKVGDVQGNSYMANLGDIPGALESYDKAIALLEPVAAAGDADDAERATLATAYLTGGGIQLVAGDALRAVAMAEKGLRLRRVLAEHHPGDPRRARDLAQAWQFYAFYLSAAGRHEESHAALRNQGTILRARLETDPRDRLARRSLGQNLYLTAECLRKLGDPEGALRAYRDAIRVGEALRLEDPGSVQFQRDLAYIHMGMGGLYESRKEYPAALAEQKSAYGLFAAMAAADTKSVDGRLGLAITLHNIGNVEAAAGDEAAAIRDFEEARSLYVPIVAADPGNAWAEGALADLYLAFGKEEERIASSRRAGAHGRRACILYSQANAIFERQRAAGRLQPNRAASCAEAAAAASRCTASP
jgi:tetratricopeptide (TPR) repeat protein